MRKQFSAEVKMAISFIFFICVFQWLPHLLWRAWCCARQDFGGLCLWWSAFNNPIDSLISMGWLAHWADNTNPSTVAPQECTDALWSYLTLSEPGLIWWSKQTKRKKDSMAKKKKKMQLLNAIHNLKSKWKRHLLVHKQTFNYKYINGQIL